MRSDTYLAQRPGKAPCLGFCACHASSRGGGLAIVGHQICVVISLLDLRGEKLWSGHGRCIMRDSETGRRIQSLNCLRRSPGQSAPRHYRQRSYLTDTLLGGRFVSDHMGTSTVTILSSCMTAASMQNQRPGSSVEPASEGDLLQPIQQNTNTGTSAMLMNEMSLPGGTYCLLLQIRLFST